MEGVITTGNLVCGGYTTDYLAYGESSCDNWCAVSLSSISSNTFVEYWDVRLGTRTASIMNTGSMRLVCWGRDLVFLKQCYGSPIIASTDSPHIMSDGKASSESFLGDWGRYITTEHGICIVGVERTNNALPVPPSVYMYRISPSGRIRCWMLKLVQKQHVFSWITPLLFVGRK